MVMHCHDGSTMGRKKISTTIYITPEQSELLKQLHDKTKVPVAEFIRQGIDMVLERERRNLPGQQQLSLDVAHDADRDARGRDRR
jgi:hypothetical protein